MCGVVKVRGMGGKDRISGGENIDFQSSLYSIVCRDMSCYYLSPLFHSYTDCVITTHVAVFQNHSHY